MIKVAIVSVLVLVSVGCSKKPTAMEVCKQVESSGVASGCRADTPNGIGAAASEKVSFDLPSVPGKTGAVFGFADDEAYDKTEKAFAAAAVLAGPHRYGSKKARSFVQINSGLSAADGAKAKAVVDGL